MKEILTIFVINLLIKEGFCEYKPCPKIFRFHSDGNEKLGYITIPPSLLNSGFNNLKVTLGLRGNITGGRNNLDLVKLMDEVVADLNQGNNMEFKLNFLQSSLSPNIIKIILNDKVICSGVEGSREHKSDVPYEFFLPQFLSTPSPSNASQLPSSDTSSVQSDNVSWLQELPFAGTCGKAFTATHTVIGGEEITEGEYPWMVAMYYYQPESEGSMEYKCGASLISDKYVITAAHCTNNQTQVLLEFGKYNIDNDYETHYVTRTSWKIFSHPEYKNSAHGDVALVSFHPPVTFTQWIVPICLWGNFDSELHEGTVAGWGQQNNNELSKSTTPRQLSISMVNLTTCRDSHMTLENLATEKTFCAGGKGSGPCHGDSGGGFFVTHKYRQYLRGIISHSIGDARVCNVQEYALYADLAYALDWMRPYLTAECEEYKQLRANMDKSLPEGNIVTSVSQYPHMVLLGFADPPTWLCTGTLISEQFILTAANCLSMAKSYLEVKFRKSLGCDRSLGFNLPLPYTIKSFDEQNRYLCSVIFGEIFKVRTAHLGFLDKENRNKSGILQEFKIIQTYIHPTFTRSRNYGDIALLKLDRPVEYTKSVVPACLHEDVTIPADNVQEIGWNYDGENSNLLQVTNITLSNDVECVSAYVGPLNRRGFDVESQFCAKFKGEECVKKPSWYNYGKPLQILDKLGAPKIVGLLSQYRSCPGLTLYTKASHYVRWIESIVWPGASVHLAH